MNIKASMLVLLLLSSSICIGQSAKVYRQSFDQFIELDSSSIVLIPIDWDNNAKMGDVKIIGNKRTKNILFYDPTNDQQKKLFDDSLQIILNYSGQMIHRSFERKADTIKQLNNEHLYYSVITEDYNRDNKLDLNDPTYLYYSKIDGTGLELLTLPSYHLKNYKYIKASNAILAILVSDDNNDKKFNSDDSEVLYKVDLNNTSRSKIIARLKLKDRSDR